MARGGGAGPADARRILDAVNEALERQPVDVVRLRKVAAVCGLATNSLRARAWPVLLGVRIDDVDREAFAEASARRHKDTSTVEARAPARARAPSARSGRRRRRRRADARGSSGAARARPGGDDTCRWT